MTKWATGKVVNGGDGRSGDGASGVYSTKNAQDLQKLLADVIATLDEIKGQL